MKWIWIVLAIFLGIGELITVEFLLLWFALGAIIAAIIANFYPFVYQLFGFVLVSFCFTIFSRKIVLRRNGAKTNVSALIGKEGLVVETVKQAYCDHGLVKVGGELWRAFTEEGEIAPGSTVTIIKVLGTKLKVQRLK